MIRCSLIFPTASESSFIIVQCAESVGLYTNTNYTRPTCISVYLNRQTSSVLSTPANPNRDDGHHGSVAVCRLNSLFYVLHSILAVLM